MEGSLKRLKTDTIDLCYRTGPTHRYQSRTSREPSRKLVRAGKVKHFGVSEMSPRTIRRAHAVHPVTAVQSEYSLLERVMEAAVLPTCEELGIGFVPWGPLGRAFLTGRFDETTKFDAADRRSSVPQFTPEALKANMPLLALVRDWAGERAAHRRSSRSPGCSHSHLSADAWSRAPTRAPMLGEPGERWPK